MRYSLKTYEHTLRIELEGELTFHDSMSFCRLIARMGRDATLNEIIINLKKVYLVDATGLSLLMLAYDMAKQTHKTIFFEDPQSQVLQTLAKATPYNALIIAA